MSMDVVYMSCGEGRAFPSFFFELLDILVHWHGARLRRGWSARKMGCDNAINTFDKQLEL